MRFSSHALAALLLALSSSLGALHAQDGAELILNGGNTYTGTVTTGINQGNLTTGINQGSPLTLGITTGTFIVSGGTLRVVASIPSSGVILGNVSGGGFLVFNSTPQNETILGSGGPLSLAETALSVYTGETSTTVATPSLIINWGMVNVSSGVITAATLLTNASIGTKTTLSGATISSGLTTLAGLSTYASTNAVAAQPAALTNPASISGGTESDGPPSIPASPPTPEPSSAALLVCGLALAGRRLRKRRA